MICEQQGNRIMTANLPDSSRRKFYPSNFSIMLIFCGDSDGHYELVQSTFDSHFKLALIVTDKILPAGSYIIMIAPEWHESTWLDPQHFNIRVGIYSPARVSLSKCEKAIGYQAIATSFLEVAHDTAHEEYEVLQGLPEVYKAGCFKHINQQPVDGLFGFIAYKNEASEPLEQRLQVSLNDAEIVWPE